MKDICIREEYTDKSGNEKVSWNKIGVLIETQDNKQYVKLFHIPNVLCNVFEQKKRDDRQSSQEPEKRYDPKTGEEVAWDE